MNNDENPSTPAATDQLNQQATSQPTVVTGADATPPSMQPPTPPVNPAQFSQPATAQPPVATAGYVAPQPMQPSAAPTQVGVSPTPDMWQTKQEYVQAQPVTADPAVPYQSSGTFVRVCAYVLGASVFMMLLASLTPVGDLFATFEIDGRNGNEIAARPLLAVAMVTAIVSYICLMSGLIAKRAKAGASKAGIITLFVLSMIALFNPISAIILLIAFFCNLSPCQSS